MRRMDSEGQENDKINDRRRYRRKEEEEQWLRGGRTQSLDSNR